MQPDGHEDVNSLCDHLTEWNPFVKQHDEAVLLCVYGCNFDVVFARTIFMLQNFQKNSGSCGGALSRNSKIILFHPNQPFVDIPQNILHNFT